MNIVNDKLLPWHMAQARKIWVTHITLGLLWSEAFLTTWSGVMFPDRSGS